eukprot:TRINITY_DN3060_c0_g2_i1.p1 TRINITY_DN3060_c0_g2~~TRINITY_DN3060_c0_g2_i1.p1  ORF type:complete len:651 (-),score=100.51 TRINITY_DN3060_c0_g2_i1:28-1887(-)
MNTINTFALITLLIILSLNIIHGYTFIESQHIILPDISGYGSFTNENGTFIFGGVRDGFYTSALYRFNETLAVWVLVRDWGNNTRNVDICKFGPCEMYPGSRSHFAEWYDEERGEYWVFGGYGYCRSAALGFCGDLWSFKDGVWTYWTYLDLTRELSSMAVEFPKVLVYGGQRSANTYSDMDVYDLESDEWINIQSGANNASTMMNLGARVSSYMWFDGGDLYLYGGLGTNDVGVEQVFNDKWKIDLALNSVTFSSSGGPFLRSRNYVSVGDSLFFFDQNRIRGSIWRYNLVTDIWEEISYSGSGSYDVSTIQYYQNKLHLLGKSDIAVEIDCCENGICDVSTLDCSSCKFGFTGPPCVPKWTIIPSIYCVRRVIHNNSTLYDVSFKYNNSEASTYSPDYFVIDGIVEPRNDSYKIGSGYINAQFQESLLWYLNEDTDPLELDSEDLYPCPVISISLIFGNYTSEEIARAIQILLGIDSTRIDKTDNEIDISFESVGRDTNIEEYLELIQLSPDELVDLLFSDRSTQTTGTNNTMNSTVMTMIQTETTTINPTVNTTSEILIEESTTITEEDIESPPPTNDPIVFIVVAIIVGVILITSTLLLLLTDNPCSKNVLQCNE